MVFRKISKLLDCYLLANDTNIYYESDDLEKLYNTINKEFGKLQLWLNVNRLSLNINKTNCYFSPPPPPPFNQPLKHQITIQIKKIAIKSKDPYKNILEL